MKWIQAIVNEYKSLTIYFLLTLLLIAICYFDPLGGDSLIFLLLTYVLIIIVSIPVISFYGMPYGNKSLMIQMMVFLIFSTITIYLFASLLESKNKDFYSIYLDIELAYWYYSTILQSFAALLGIIGAFSIYGFTKPRKSYSQNIYGFTKPRKSYSQNEEIKDAIKRIFPSIIYISLLIFLLLILLPMSNFLINHKSVFATSLFMTTLLGITAVASLCIGIYGLYKNALKE